MLQVWVEVHRALYPDAHPRCSYLLFSGDVPEVRLHEDSGGRMSEEMPPSMAKGSEFATDEMLSPLAQALDRVDNRTHFWAGVIGTLYGAMVADLGEERASLLFQGMLAAGPVGVMVQ